VSEDRKKNPIFRISSEQIKSTKKGKARKDQNESVKEKIKSIHRGQSNGFDMYRRPCGNLSP